MPSEASLANLRPAWQPGRSAYAPGAAKGYRRVLALARKNSPEAMQTLIECMHDTAAGWPVRVHAAIAVIERAWGKPEAKLSLDGADGANVLILTGVPRSGEDVASETTIVADDTTYTIDMDGAEDDAS